MKVRAKIRIRIVLITLLVPFTAYCAHLNLDRASKKGDNTIDKALLAGGADVNAKNEDGETALILAERKGYKEIIYLLDQAGAKE